MTFKIFIVIVLSSIKGCDGEEIFPPVNRRVVTPVIPVLPWWGSFEFSLFSLLSFGFKYPVSAVYRVFLGVYRDAFYFDFHISCNSASSSCLFLVIFCFFHLSLTFLCLNSL